MKGPLGTPEQKGSLFPACSYFRMALVAVTSFFYSCSFATINGEICRNVFRDLRQKKS